MGQHSGEFSGQILQGHGEIGLDDDFDSASWIGKCHISDVSRKQMFVFTMFNFFIIHEVPFLDLFSSTLLKRI